MIDPVSRQGRSHGSRSRLHPDERSEGAAAPALAGNRREHTSPEDRYCSSCGWPDECARNRSCHRRDSGEIRSPYSESARGALTPAAQPDAGATSSSSDAPRPESVPCFDPGAARHGSGSGLRVPYFPDISLMLPAALVRINYQSAIADMHEASCGAAPSGASSPTSPGAPDAACPVLLEGGVDD